MKKFLFLIFAIFLCMLAGCGQKTPSSSASPTEPFIYETLRLELPRSTKSETLMAVLQVLPKNLQTALEENGVTVQNIEISVGSSLAATAQALNAGTVHMAVFPGEIFAALGENSIPLLAEQMRGTIPSSTDVSDWAGAQSQYSSMPSAGVRMLVVAGPSHYGQQLAARSASGSPLSWEELDRARWVIGSQPESSMASVWLADRYEGNISSDLTHLTFEEDSELLLKELANGTTDIAVIPADLRIDYADPWTQNYNRPSDIWQETTVIGVTESYYQSILAVCPDDETLHSEHFQNALGKAISDVCLDSAEVTDVLGGILSVPVSNSDLDGLRRMLTLPG